MMPSEQKPPEQMPEDQLLQDILQQLEAGASIEERLADLSKEEADLVKLVASLREMPFPERDAKRAAAQRTQYLRQMVRASQMSTQTARMGMPGTLSSLRNWLRPRAAFAGAIAVLSVCILLVLLATGVLRSSREPADVTSVAIPAATPELHIVQQTLPESTASLVYEAYIPIASAPEVRDPTSATLQDPHGLVEVQLNNGPWTAARPGDTIVRGQRLRTGVLSSAWLAFYDGSQALLGPSTEVSIQELDANRGDGPRIVTLEQRVGVTYHDVMPAKSTDSRYAVLTASATGAAMGTEFHVRVAQDQDAQFSVDQGTVAVTSRDVTIDVVAGQSTTVSAGQIPDAPTFRISGEGQVTQTGSTWTIAGQDFDTHDDTVIVGNPQDGDWVFVEGRLLADGTRIADRILLLLHSPANRFTITGRAEIMGDAEWLVAGQTILVDGDTFIDPDIEAEALVRVEGVILQDGSLLAERIRLVEEAPGLPFEFVGIVQEMDDESWTISDVIVTVDDETETDLGLDAGELVTVRGWILADGVWLARSITRTQELERGFEFTGAVESIDPWVVGGIPFETRGWTLVEPQIGIGDLVLVRGRILEDGTWVASEITRLDDDDGVLISFVGRVEDMDPWKVGEIPLNVNEDTTIVGDIQVGDLVKVTVRIHPEGAWLATRIELLDTGEVGLGCVYITAVVVAVGPDGLEVPNWPVIDLDGVPIDGEIQVGSVIMMLVCVNSDGAIDILRIIVIYEPEPVIPPDPPLPVEENHKVTVCHKPNGKNPHAITISRSALPAHLAHGDIEGPCQ